MAKQANSRIIGASIELQARDLLRACGFEAERGKQWSGSEESPDVIVEKPLRRVVHIEVKGNAKYMSKFARQTYLKAEEESGVTQIPVIMHRYLMRRGMTRKEIELGSRFLVTVDARFFFQLLRKVIRRES